MAEAMINDKYINLQQQQQAVPVSMPPGPNPGPATNGNHHQHHLGSHHTQSHSQSHQHSHQHSHPHSHPHSHYIRTSHHLPHQSHHPTNLNRDARDPSNTTSASTTAPTSASTSATTAPTSTSISISNAVTPNSSSTPSTTTGSNTSRKYKVNFDLPPTKRQKRNDNGNVQNVISAIQTCVSSSDRLDAIYEACSKFDHDIQTTHDTEIAMGADIALFKHLPLLIIKRQRIIKHLDANQQQHKHTNAITNNSTNVVSLSSSSASSLSSTALQYNEEYVAIIEEISNTFTALEMVLRCSADSISTCHARIGIELFTFLIEIIQDLCIHLSLVVREVAANEENNHDHEKKKQPTSSSSLISEENKEITLDDHDHDDNKICEDQQKQQKQQQQQQQQQRHENEQNDSTSSLDNHALSKSRSLDGSSSSSQTSTQPLSNVLIASKVILRTTTKIIAHFGRVGSLTEALANTPNLLNTLCTVIAMPRGIGYNDENNIPIEARLNCLWIIANLACSAENMVLMAKNEKMTENLFEILTHPTINEEESCKDIDQFICLLRMRSVAVRAVLNLSWAQQNKVPFSENVHLVECILRIASHRKSPWCGSGKGVSGILLQARRHACGTLRNIAAAPRKYKRRLCRLKKGKFLDVLADIAKNDHDCEVKEKIHATLFNLVSADTAKMFTEKKEVLNVIIAAATASEEKNGVDEEDQNNNNNNKSSCRKMAENILRSLEKALPEDDEGYDALRPALSRFDSQVAINRSTSYLAVNRSTSNFGSETLSVSNFGNLPSMSNFSLGDINVSFSHSNLNPETV